MKISGEKAQSVADSIANVTSDNMLSDVAAVAKLVEVLEEMPQGEVLLENCKQMQVMYNDHFVGAVEKFKGTLSSIGELEDYIKRAASALGEVTKMDADVDAIKALEIPTSV